VLRGGATPGVNYYGLVAPQLTFRAGIANLQQQTAANQALITGLTVGALGQQGPLTTGQPFGFQNHRGFFQNQLTAGALGQGGLAQGGGFPAQGAFGLGSQPLPGAGTGGGAVPPRRGGR
jgi:hypothetical protein